MYPTSLIYVTSEEQMIEALNKRYDFASSEIEQCISSFKAYREYGFRKLFFVAPQCVDYQGQRINIINEVTASLSQLYFSANEDKEKLALDKDVFFIAADYQMYLTARGKIFFSESNSYEIISAMEEKEDCHYYVSFAWTALGDILQHAEEHSSSGRKSTVTISKQNEIECGGFKNAKVLLSYPSIFRKNSIVPFSYYKYLKGDNLDKENYCYLAIGLFVDKEYLLRYVRMSADLKKINSTRLLTNPIYDKNVWPIYFMIDR